MFQNSQQLTSAVIFMTSHDEREYARTLLSGS